MYDTARNRYFFFLAFTTWMVFKLIYFSIYGIYLIEYTGLITEVCQDLKQDGEQSGHQIKDKRCTEEAERQVYTGYLMSMTIIYLFGSYFCWVVYSHWQNAIGDFRV